MEKQSYIYSVSKSLEKHKYDLAITILERDFLIYRKSEILPSGDIVMTAGRRIYEIETNEFFDILIAKRNIEIQEAEYHIEQLHRQILNALR
jgi:hypothetical protein